MEIVHLSDTVEITTVSEDGRHGVFEVAGLYAGYGFTLGNALRRSLLSSLPGAAVTYLKFKGIPHEFSTIPGVKEDVVELTLNFKKIRFRMHTSEPQILFLSVKGEREVRAKDISPNAEVEVVNPDALIATLTDSNAALEAEITVERGLGYSAVESRSGEKFAVGLIGVDAFFSPVLNVNYTVENMRVGDRTDYNRLRIEIETDGTISPSAALHKAGNILKDHFGKIAGMTVQSFSVEPEESTGPKKKRDLNEKEE